MTLLEVIAKAANPEDTIISSSQYPIAFKTGLILPNLKPESENPNSRVYLVEPINGFRISDTDSAVADSNIKFYKSLMRLLNAKGPESLSSSGFIGMLISFLEQIGSQVGVSVDREGEPSNEVYAQRLIEAVRHLMSRDVVKLLTKGCVLLGIWELLQTLIVNKLVVRGLQSELLSSLIEKNRSDLVCLCVKCFSDIDLLDLHWILKCFLSPSKEARVNMAGVRKEWEDEALLAAKKAEDNSLAEKKLRLAKDAAILLMVAYDEFSSPELCLHYLISLLNVDDMMFSSAVCKLNVDEILALIRYLGKWLKKYERFPQAIPCPEAPIMLGLNACRWVPTVEDVAKILGLVLDEHFSSLVLHSEFHKELKSVECVLNSLVAEGRLCGYVASLIEISKPEVKTT